MGLFDLLAVCWRRWPILLALIALSAVLTWRASVVQPVYWARTQVVFLATPTEGAPNNLNAGAGPVALAGVVARAVSGKPDEPRTVSWRIPLAYQGLKKGERIYQPDTGLQWSHDWSLASVVVDVVDRDRDAVLSRTNQAVARVRNELVSLQDQMNVDPSNRVGSRLVPAQPVVVEEAGQPTKILAAGLGLGAGMSVALTVVADQVLNRRRRHLGSGT